ncbi:MAG: hypothetical protein LBE48_05185 [Methanomassiliicoccaceae archaeon]|jgi:hypothetical protein|nr:hypothetical protein [Methanomassiliicoccaceae archaeon]
MPEITIDLSDDLYDKIRLRAEAKEWSVSELVKTVIIERFNGWPAGFFEKYVGIFKDIPFEEPEEIPWELNIPRLSFDD